MTRSRQSVELAGSALSHSCHVCAFFSSKEDEYRVLMPFIKDALDPGQEAARATDPVGCQHGMGVRGLARWCTTSLSGAIQRTARWERF
jgi:hypothetical protein